MKRPQPLKLIWWLVAAILIGLISAGYSWMRYVDYHHPEMHLQYDPWSRYVCRHLLHYINYATDSDPGWLESCTPDRVQLEWRPASGWMAEAIINLNKSTISGGVSNGKSYTHLYPDAGTERTSLTDEQVSQIREILRQLPLGDSYETSRQNYAEEFHIAFFKDGVLQVRHYSDTRLPQPVVQMGKLLQLKMPEQN